MNPIFYVLCGAVGYMLIEEVAHSLRYLWRQRKLRELLEARHKENGLRIMREISGDIDEPLRH